MEFENEDHSRTGMKLLKATEELIETLEDNQVMSMNFKHCAYICRFNFKT